MIIEKAKVVFASSFVFMLKAWNFHWNVEGKDFTQLHELFEKIYSEVQGSIDTLAEHIRALDSYAPGTMERMKELSMVTESTIIPSGIDMVKYLKISNETLLKELIEAYEMAEKEKEYGFSKFVQDRIEAHKKHDWMLRSTLHERQNI